MYSNDKLLCYRVIETLTSIIFLLSQENRNTGNCLKMCIRMNEDEKLVNILKIAYVFVN